MKQTAIERLFGGDEELPTWFHTDNEMVIASLRTAADCIAFVREFAAGPPIYDTEGLTPSEAMSVTFVNDGARAMERGDALAALAARIESASSEGSAT